VLRLVKELKLEDVTYFLGRVPDPDLHKLYVAAHCHVHPAHYEGFGLPPLEAMACGTPTIVSNTSSLPEVVGDAALLVNPENWEELAVAMHRLLTDEQLYQELRAKGLQRAAFFSWEITAEKTLHVYRRVVETRKPSGAALPRSSTR
jgi:glycosyltransferase involved in cell wall biosynthesis